MKAEEVKPIVDYLIEEYFENNGGIEDYKEKEVEFECFGVISGKNIFSLPDTTRVGFDWVSGINSKGGKDVGYEHFDFKDGEKITNLQNYVWEAIDRILKVPYYDERPREIDPTLQ